MESWKEFRSSLEPFIYEHWSELAQDRQFEPNLDDARYQELDDHHILHILTARENGELVGYFVATVLPHLHYKDAGQMAYVDFYYVRPAWRSVVGVQLFLMAERTLKARGVVKVYLTCKVNQDHSELFKRMGWRPSDYVFTKLLN